MNISKKYFVIINPTSGNGTSKKLWPKIKASLDELGLLYEFSFTDYPNHSLALVRDAVNQGVKDMICVGGDGTLHNIVNGAMKQKVFDPTLITIGVIPIGTGNDWIKTYNIPIDYKKALKVIINGKIIQQDIGKITFHKEINNIVYFNNLAGIGFDGLVVSKVGKYKHFGSLAYLIGAVLGLFSYKNFNAQITINKETLSFNALMVLIGICKFSGGGMQLTKAPNPVDGNFDISIAHDFSRMNIITNLKNLFNGKIVAYKKVQCFKSSLIELQVKTNNAPFIQADGELLGKGDFSAEVIPKAIGFYVS